MGKTKWIKTKKLHKTMVQSAEESNYVFEIIRALTMEGTDYR